MPAIEPKKLKRLLIIDLLAPYAMKRGLARGLSSPLVGNFAKHACVLG